jgi:serine/threonine-protein kinase
MSRPRDKDLVIKVPSQGDKPEEDPDDHHEVTPIRPVAKSSDDPHVDTHPELQAKVKEPRGSGVGVGTIVGGRYRLVEKLGGGAMGEVYVAENLAIRLRVAVKLLKRDLAADAVFRERFQQEAQAIAAIDHPNVARFLDLVMGDPTFLVMEYVTGETLAERLRKGPLPLAEGVQIAIRLAWAVGAAHAAGIVHRDLKPSNVILKPDMEHGEVPKLIDFGLAKLARQVEKSGLTRTGQVVGTPKYMSPEQISGRSVDNRSDIYSLGCLLYEMIAGRPPFDGEDDVQVLYQQIHDDAAPIRKHMPDVPEQLEKVIARALCKDPEQRPATVADLARTLEATALMVGLSRSSSAELYPIADELGTMERLPSAAHKSPRGGGRKAWPYVAGALALGLLAGGGMFFVGQSRAHESSGLIVLSDPSDATVVLDGKPFPRKTPTWIAGVEPGNHSLKLEHGGNAPITQQVPLKAGERAVVQISLPPTTRRLEVRSTPDGASVYLDGRLAFGETPTYVDIIDGEFHELRLVKNGYQTLVKPITPDDRMPSLTLTLKPEAQARGTLMVDANGAAEVWIDGLNTGYTTPTLGIQVVAGKHTVELRDGTGGKGQSTTVTVGQGQTVRLLLAAPGTPEPPQAPAPPAPSPK